MKRIFIVHPTSWVKVAIWFAKPFVKKKFWRKLTYIQQLRDIYETFDADTLRIPKSILQYDREHFRATYAFGGGSTEKKGRDNSGL
jgi:Rho GTPase-activating protein 1